MSKPDADGLTKVGWTAKTKILPKQAKETAFQLKVRGTYGVRVVNPEVFAESMTKAGATTPRGIRRALEKIIALRLNTMLSNTLDTPQELEKCFGDVAVETRLGVKYQFSRLGLDLVDFLVLSIEPEPGRKTKKPLPSGPRRATGAVLHNRVGRAKDLKFPRRRH